MKGHPGDSRAWSFLADSLPAADRAEREAALRRAVDLAPGEPPGALRPGPPAPRGGAVRARRSRRPGSRSSSLPFSPEVLDTYGAVSADLGNCGQAVLAARRAIDVYPERGGPEGRMRLEERLSGYEALCGVHRP